MDPPSAFHASPFVYYSIWVVCLRACVSVRDCVFMFEFVCGCPRARVLQSSLHVDVLSLGAIVCASDEEAALISDASSCTTVLPGVPRPSPGPSEARGSAYGDGTVCLYLSSLLHISASLSKSVSLDVGDGEGRICVKTNTYLALWTTS